MKFKKGFTGSEGLVILVIVIIFAVIMTVVLHKKFKKADIESRLKKTFVTMSQAATRAELYDNSWGQWIETENNDGSLSNNESEEYFFNNYLKPYLTKMKIQNDGMNVCASLADGSTITIDKGTCLDITFDVNGKKRPNEFAKDRFVFTYCGSSITDRPTNRLIPYGFYNDSTFPTAMQMCKSTPAKCSTLIMLNNWKIPKNYPYKI